MDQKNVPAINRRLGYVRTSFGTVRADGDGVALFATSPQLQTYAEESGILVDAEAAWVELDNAGRVLYAVPDEEALERPLNRWVDALLARAREYEVEEVFFRGYTAGLRTIGARSPAPAPPARPPRRAPRPGSMRDHVLHILKEAGDVWLTANEVTDRARNVIGEELNRRSVYNAIVKEVKRGTVRRQEADGNVKYRLPEGRG